MTELEFLQSEKRALERLNPRMLSVRDYANTTDAGCTVCAMGAWKIAETQKGRVDPGELQAKVRNTPWPELPRADWPDSPLDLEIQDINDHFRAGSESKRDQIARWKYVHKWVCDQIRQRERAYFEPATLETLVILNAPIMVHGSERTEVLIDSGTDNSIVAA